MNLIMYLVAGAFFETTEAIKIKFGMRTPSIKKSIKAIKTTDKDIAKTELLAKGFREAGQTVTNAFRTFADKPEVDYSQKEQKHPITKAVLAPMKAVKKMLVLMEIHLDASIDKLDNLAMDVQLDKEKHMENAKAQKQTEPERAEAERVEAEVVYAPMVAEPQEYQYNADAFEANTTAAGMLEHLQIYKKKRSSSVELQKEIDKLHQMKSKAEAKKFQLYDDYTKGIVQRDIMVSERTTLTERIGEIEIELHELESKIQLEQCINKAGEEETIELLSKMETFDLDIIRQVVKRITMYDDGNIQFEWNVDDFLQVK